MFIGAIQKRNTGIIKLGKNQSFKQMFMYIKGKGMLVHFETEKRRVDFSSNLSDLNIPGKFLI